MNRDALRERYPTLLREYPPLAPVERTGIVVGRDQKRRPISIPRRVRNEHVLVVGSTGSGKSSAMYHFGHQVMKHGEGLMALDPHGNATDSVYNRLLTAAARIERKVHVIDPNASRVIGFNPLARPEGTDVSVVVGNVMDAISIGWEGENLSTKPTIERNLSAILSALVELNLTLCEAHFLYDREDVQGLRRYAIENVKNNYTRIELLRLQELASDGRRKREYDQETIGTHNRLARLLRPRSLHAMLGQKDHCIDLRKCMDDGDIVLVNLAGGSQVYEGDADLFGRLLVRSSLFHAKRRQNNRQFTLMLDEAPRFFSEDIPILLAEVRKNGISVVAGMQWLQQARQYDENMLAALLNGTNAKICFRVREPEEAEKLARALIPFNLERPVDALIKPTVVGHQRTLLKNEATARSEAQTEGNARSHTVSHGFSETEAESYSEGTSETESTGSSSMSASGGGKASGSGSSSGEMSMPDGEPSRSSSGDNSSDGKSSSHSHADGASSLRTSGSSSSQSWSVAVTRSHSEAHGVTASQARTEGTSRTAGTSEAFEPIMANLPSTVHSIQNEMYAAGRLLMNLPTATGYISYVAPSGSVATLFSVPPILIKPLPREQLEEIRSRILDECQAVSYDDALQLIEHRELPIPMPIPTKKKKTRGEW